MEEDIKYQDSILKKIIKIIFKILYQMLIILCFILTVIIVLQKITDSDKSIAGYRIFRVITGSMEPEYGIGEVVISKEINPKDIKLGDDIVYLGKYGEYNGKIIMHSVIAIDKDENGNFYFHAKGLHNSSVEDPHVEESQIYGVVKFKSRILTILYKLATNIYSVFVIITILVLNVFISFRINGKRTVQQLGEARNTEYENLENKDYDDDYEENIEEEEDTEDTENKLEDEDN